MEIQVNGELRILDESQTIAQLLRGMGLEGRRVAVERNGEIVPRSLHPETVLAAGDRLEIVVAVGGG